MKNIKKFLKRDKSGIQPSTAIIAIVAVVVIIIMAYFCLLYIAPLVESDLNNGDFGSEYDTGSDSGKYPVMGYLQVSTSVTFTPPTGLGALTGQGPAYGINSMNYNYNEEAQTSTTYDTSQSILDGYSVTYTVIFTVTSSENNFAYTNNVTSTSHISGSGPTTFSVSDNEAMVIRHTGTYYATATLYDGSFDKIGSTSEYIYVTGNATAT